MKNRRPFSDLIFLLLIFFLAIVSFISYQRIIKLNEATNLVLHTNTVKLKLTQTLSLLKEAESRQQESISALPPQFNIQLQNDSTATFGILHDLDSLTRDNQNQQARIEAIRQRVA